MLGTFDRPTRTPSLSDAAALLRDADRLVARAVAIIAASRDPLAGLSPHMHLVLDAHRTRSDARALIRAAAVLARMPATRGRFARGEVSWSQVAAITSIAARVPVAAHAELDAIVAGDASSDPEELLGAVDDAAARVRPDLDQARADRQVAASFLAVQPAFDGSATIFGHADAVSAATIVSALDAHADAPHDPDEPDAPSRAQQRFDALVRVCERALAGSADGTTRPRPRLLATIDANDPQARARVLWNLPGRAPRLTPLASAELACDADTIPILLHDGIPISVGQPVRIPTAVRTALAARDAGCRFPTCGAPAAWTDAHHIRPLPDGPSTLDNLILLCRRCHARIHRHRWTITLEPTGDATFHQRGRQHTSTPHTRRE